MESLKTKILSFEELSMVLCASVMMSFGGTINWALKHGFSRIGSRIVIVFIALFAFQWIVTHIAKNYNGPWPKKPFQFDLFLRYELLLASTAVYWPVFTFKIKFIFLLVHFSIGVIAIHDQFRLKGLDLLRRLYRFFFAKYFYVIVEEFENGICEMTLRTVKIQNASTRAIKENLIDALDEIPYDEIRELHVNCESLEESKMIDKIKHVLEAYAQLQGINEFFFTVKKVG
ncbi:hypothetical protein OAB57_00420 [Bacteriovoracaceae bacterium]|nr:hypothetical protein [Bacteriovoracaceae bacterium]